jgi:hypothetical protein
VSAVQRRGVAPCTSLRASDDAAPATKAARVTQGIELYRCGSLLGYCMLPIVLFSAAAVVLPARRAARLRAACLRPASGALLMRRVAAEEALFARSARLRRFGPPAPPPRCSRPWCPRWRCGCIAPRSACFVLAVTCVRCVALAGAAHADCIPLRPGVRPVHAADHRLAGFKG